MKAHLAPIVRVVDASVAAEWYARHLGFATEFEHRFAPGLPLYVGLVRDDARIHLSEHTGDARPRTLIYLWVPDVDAAAAPAASPRSTTTSGAATSRSATPTATASGSARRRP